MTTIGTAEFLTKIPTANEAKAPNPNCIAPIKADALPAFLEKGARVSPAVLGFDIPKQARNRNNMVIVPYKPNKPFIASIRNIITMTDCVIKAPKIICSLLNLFNKTEFN